jgi:hypothetical protein
MPCSITCLISLSLIIAMIYFHNATTNNKTIINYKKQLPKELSELYDKIRNERLRINYFGYSLGFMLSLLIILYNYSLKRNKLTNTSLICLVIVVTFFTNYFYYILSPKSTYMLDNINSPEQTRAWLQMYREMQYQYHFGMVIGIIAVVMLALAFRC